MLHPPADVHAVAVLAVAGVRHCEHQVRVRRPVCQDAPLHGPAALAHAPRLPHHVVLLVLLRHDGVEEQDVPLAPHLLCAGGRGRGREGTGGLGRVHYGCHTASCCLWNAARCYGAHRGLGSPPLECVAVCGGEEGMEGRRGAVKCWGIGSSYRAGLWPSAMTRPSSSDQPWVYTFGVDHGGREGERNGTGRGDGGGRVRLGVGPSGVRWGRHQWLSRYRRQLPWRRNESYDYAD